MEEIKEVEVQISTPHKFNCFLLICFSDSLSEI